MQNGLKRPSDLPGQARAELIMAQEITLYQEAGYIWADFLLRLYTSPLHSRGGPYIFAK
jgi:hypothetical protein